MATKLFVHHYLGDYVRTNDWLGATRDAPIVTEYRSLDDVPEPDRGQFAWMLEHGQVCTSCGANVYQIRTIASNEG